MSRFKNKYFSVLGDSISTLDGYIPTEYPTFYSKLNACFTGVYSKDETWWGRVISHFGGELLVNNSWSGSNVCRAEGCEIESYGCSDERAMGLDRDGVMPDVILIYIGTNDRGRGYELISEDKNDLTVIDNAYRKMLEKIRGKYPNAEVFCCTFPITDCSRDPQFRFPLFNGKYHMAEYGEVIKSAAADYNCRSVELRDNNIMCDTLEGLHPNYDGMKMIAEKVIGEMERE